MLGSDVTSASLWLSEGETLTVDLGTHKLTLYGNGVGAGTEPGNTGMANDGTLYIKNGDLDVFGGDGAEGVEGAAGGVGGIAVENSGALILHGVKATIEGGTGGAGRNGGAGVTNTGVIASSTALDLSGGDGGDAVDSESAAGNDGIESFGLDLSANLDGNGTAAPDSFTVYGSGTIAAAAGKLAAEPLTWPLRDGYDLDGWFDARTGGAQIDSETNVGDEGFDTVYAHWTAVATTTTATSAPTTSGGAGGGGPIPTSTATTTTVPVTPTPVTTSTPASTAASTTKASTPISTTSIPTNNVTDPVTFTSSQAPSAPPLPGSSSVNDTSASQFDVDTHTPTQGGDLTLVAKGFKPGSVVDFWVHSTPTYLGSAIADVRGIAVLPVKLDKALVGEHHVQSVGIGLLGEPRNLAQPITIAAPPALASTGVATWPLTALAPLLIAAGAGLLMVQRARRTQGGANHL